MSLDEAMREHWNSLFPNEIPSRNYSNQCPITGSDLICVEKSGWAFPIRALDAPIYYRSIDNPDLIWMRNPRSFGFLTLVESIGSTKGIRFFKEVNEEWIELFEVKGYGLFFPADTPDDEIQLEKNRIDREREEMAAVKAMFPKAVKVEAKSVDVSDIPVQPLTPLSNELFWIPFVYEEHTDKIEATNAPSETTAHELKTRFPLTKFNLNN